MLDNGTLKASYKIFMGLSYNITDHPLFPILETCKKHPQHYVGSKLCTKRFPNMPFQNLPASRRENRKT